MLPLLLGCQCAASKDLQAALLLPVNTRAATSVRPVHRFPPPYHDVIGGWCRLRSSRICCTWHICHARV